MKISVIKYATFICLAAFLMQMAAPLLPACPSTLHEMEMNEPDTEREPGEKDRKLAFEELTDAVPGTIDITIIAANLAHPPLKDFDSLPEPHSDVHVPPPDQHS